MAEFRLGIAIVFGVAGIALTVGKVGGRGLPLVAADLLKFNLGARRYAGSPNQLARSEAPPVPEAKPDPLRLLAKKAAGGIGKAVKSGQAQGPSSLPAPQLVRQAETAQGRAESANGGNASRPNVPETREKKPWYRLLAVAGLLAVTVIAIPRLGPGRRPRGRGPGLAAGRDLL